MNQPDFRNRSDRNLLVLIVLMIILSLATVALAKATGRSWNQSVATISALDKIFVFLSLGAHTENDSWGPMIFAYRMKHQNPDRGLYDMFFREGMKFQYPPLTILPCWYIPEDLTQGEHFNLTPSLMGILTHCSRVAVVVTIFLSVYIYRTVQKRLMGSLAQTFSWKVILLLIVACLTFYPLMIGFAKGQMQVFLTAIVAAGIAFQLAGKNFLCGACLGLCCLVKPQYAVPLVWAAARTEWRFVWGFLAVFCPSIALSLWHFGIQDHLQYLTVVRSLGNTGEVYWHNNSVNGIMNRFMYPDSFYSAELPEYHAAVYYPTVISSAMILIVALWKPRNIAYSRDIPIDFLTVLAACTMASPIAWQYHYGTFLPIFAVLLPLSERVRPFGRATIPLLGLGFITMAINVDRLGFFTRNPFMSLLASHLYFGAVITFVLLLAFRRATAVRVGPDSTGSSCGLVH